MTRRARLLLDAAMLLTFLAALAPVATGIALHELLGLALFATAFMHLVLNWDWVMHVAARVFIRIRTTSKVRLASAALLFGSAVTVTLSGLMISEALASAIGVTAVSGGAWSVIHSLSARSAVVLLAIHIGLHGSWIAHTLRGMLPSLRPVGVRS